MQEVMTVKEAANFLHCSGSLIYKLFDKGEIKGYRVGSRGIRLYIESLISYRDREVPQPVKAKILVRRKPPTLQIFRKTSSKKF